MSQNIFLFEKLIDVKLITYLIKLPLTLFKYHYFTKGQIKYCNFRDLYLFYLEDNVRVCALKSNLLSYFM